MAHTGNPLPAERSGRRSEIQQVLDYLNQCDLREDLPLSRLAQLSGLSVETFRKRFFEAMGDSPVHYLLKRRLTAAKELLSSTDMSVMQVGEAVGFSDPYYFSRVFRKYQGLSPSAFRLNFFSERFKV